MRITRDLLLKIAQEKADEYLRGDRGILGAYLYGSLLTQEPLLGGATDIDLVLVHHEDLAERREIVRLTAEIHLDIMHHGRGVYRHAKELRGDPWLGPVLYAAKILHDSQHFLDFIQASVRGQFYRPDNVLKRASALAEQARQTWMALNLQPPPGLPAKIAAYLLALETAANAVASLSGPPLATRRLLREFPERTTQIGHSGLSTGLLGLLGSANVDADSLRSWLNAWTATLEAIPPAQLPAQLQPSRWGYYRQGIEALLISDKPPAALWPLLTTWTQAVGLLAERTPLCDPWEQVIARLGLSGAAFDERLTALDAYLDTVEDVLEAWGRANGA